MSTNGIIGLERRLRATLCEIECGMFYVTYPDGEVAADGLPVYQAGKSASDARQQIELKARSAGYDNVSWTAANVAPLFPLHAQAEPGEAEALYAGGSAR